MDKKNTAVSFDKSLSSKEFMGITELCSRFREWIRKKKENQPRLSKGENSMKGGFSDSDIDLMERMIKREIAGVDTILTIDPQIANQTKAKLKDLLARIKSNPQILQDSDILTLDEEVVFDEIIFAKNGEPMARVRLPKPR